MSTYTTSSSLVCHQCCYCSIEEDPMVEHLLHHYGASNYDQDAPHRRFLEDIARSEVWRMRNKKENKKRTAFGTKVQRIGEEISIRISSEADIDQERINAVWFVNGNRIKGDERYEISAGQGWAMMKAPASQIQKQHVNAVIVNGNGIDVFDLFVRASLLIPPSTPPPPTTARYSVYVSNLPYHTTEADLLNFFAMVGAVTKIRIIYKNGNSTGFGFCEFADQQGAMNAIAILDGKPFDGRTLTVKWSNRAAQFVSQ